MLARYSRHREVVVRAAQKVSAAVATSYLTGGASSAVVQRSLAEVRLVPKVPARNMAIAPLRPGIRRSTPSRCSQ